MLKNFFLNSHLTLFTIYYISFTLAEYFTLVRSKNFYILKSQKRKIIIHLTFSNNRLKKTFF